MTGEARSLVQFEAKPGALPRAARSRSGVVFDATADRWSYRDGVTNVSLDFSAIPAIHPRLRWSLKKVLLWYVESSSASHFQNMHSYFLRFARFLDSSGRAHVEEITATDLLNYRASLTADISWYLGTLSGFLTKWHRLGIPGVAADAAGLLGEMRIKGNRHGVAVLTMDPVKGPFTNIEQEAIQSALHEAFASGSIEEAVYLLAWLMMALGQRPSQYAALKACDVIKVTEPNGEVRYAIKIPRVKQRFVEARKQFKERPLIPQIGEQLYAYAQGVRATFAGVLADSDQAPLFPAASQRGRKLPPPGFEYHDTAKNMAQRLSGALGALEVPSERTGLSLNITPIRFRRTFGTRAAQEGHGELVIAELLDHSDTQHVGVYVAAVPEIAERIDRAVAMALAPLAQAFAGVIIANESQATRAGDPSSRIIDLRTDQQKPMGSCGQHSFCSFSAPIACYTCKNFEPWLDGPHERLLDRLIAERNRLMVSTDPRIAATNDRTILAVAEVILQCQEARALEVSANG